MGGAGVPEPGVSRSLARSRSSRISKLRYTLALDIPADPATPIDGRVEIAFDLKNIDEPLAIDFRDAGTLLRTVTIPTAPTGRIDVEVVNGHIVVPPAALRDGTNVIVITFAAGPSIQRRDDLVYSLFVPAKAHHAFPCFDQPDLKAEFGISVTAPADWTVLSNGHENSVNVNGDRCEFVFRSTRPISTYLVAIVAGRLVVDTAERNGRTLRMFSPVVDEALLDRNRNAIFELHATALAWLEQYTAIDYPFDTFDFVLIPAFQFGGMEHPGAVYYNASSLLLDLTPTEQQLLARAHLIAHETAHMWFGNYTTMPWFDDVWMKEVFANLMAAKIVEPMFPALDHDLRFLLSHYPAAFAVDRTGGAHPVRQELDNLDDAGSLYGPIVYQKAPILMRDIECRMGEERLRDALRNYLETHAYGCAAWPELARIMTSRGLTYLDDRHPFESAGLPITLLASDAETMFARARPVPAFLPYGRIRFDGRARQSLMSRVGTLPDAFLRGAAWIYLWEDLLGNLESAPAFLEAASDALRTEGVEQIVQLVGDYTRDAFWRLLPADRRAAVAPAIEHALLARIAAASTSPTLAATCAALFRTIVTTATGVQSLHDMWRRRVVRDDLPAGEGDEVAMAFELAIRVPDAYDAVVQEQRSRLTDVERLARFDFVAAAVSRNGAVRAGFFNRLADPAHRRREPWVIEGLRYLNHPLRAAESLEHLPSALDMLEEIRRTGDIFFPKNWLDAVLWGHNSGDAAAIVRTFLDARPDYPVRLRRLVLQSADLLVRRDGSDG